MYSFLSSQTHAEVTLAKTDATLREKEDELSRLRSEHLALQEELKAVTNCLDTFKETVKKLHEEGRVGILKEFSCESGVLKCVKLWPLCLFSLKTMLLLSLRLLTGS